MAAVAGEVVLVGGAVDSDIWLLGAPPPSPAPPLVPPLAPPVDAGGSGSGGVGGGTTGGGAGAAAGPGGVDDAGAPSPGGGADAGGLPVECNTTRDCAAGLTCDVNHHCVGAGSPDAGAVTINEPQCAAPASAMITSLDTGPSLVDLPYTSADVGLTPPTISTASGAFVISFDTGRPTTTNLGRSSGCPSRRARARAAPA
jgi:hypothetical protein